jgi:hypothetical protein
MNTREWREQKGKIGQALVEEEIRANTGEWAAKGVRLERGWLIVDGHERQTHFTNIERIQHVDTVIATPQNDL